jgi:hypothetical protein
MQARPRLEPRRGQNVANVAFTPSAASFGWNVVYHSPVWSDVGRLHHTQRDYLRAKGTCRQVDRLSSLPKASWLVGDRGGGNGVFLEGKNREQMQQYLGVQKLAYSITSSARARSIGGISWPIPFAVARLKTNSNLLDSSTGRSAGLAPLRIRPA